MKFRTKPKIYVGRTYFVNAPEWHYKGTVKIKERRDTSKQRGYNCLILSVNGIWQRGREIWLEEKYIKAEIK